MHHLKKYNRFVNLINGQTIVELTQGQHTILWAYHWELLKHIKWFSQWSNFTKTFYVHGREPLSGKRVCMHRMILGLTKREDEGDHINSDTLNNLYPENLRVATKSQNSMNRGKNKNNTSGFKGVSWDKEKNKWKAKIGSNNKQISLGYFNNKEDAIKIIKESRLKHHKEFSSE